MFYEKLLALIFEKSDQSKTLFKFDKDSLIDVVRDMVFDSGRFCLEIGGIKLTKTNVPSEYVEFVEKIHEIRELKIVDRSTIDKVCESMMMKESFQPMIKKVQEFYMACLYPKKSDDTKKHHRDDYYGLHQIPDSLPLVDRKAVRDTFYNVMVEQVVLHNFIPKCDLLDQEAYIYVGLPALAVIEIIIMSKNINGIRLSNGVVVTTKNCPKLLKSFCKYMMAMKNKINSMNLFDKQIKTLKLLSLQSPDLKMPSDLICYSQNLMPIVADIISISIAISQVKPFKLFIDNVIKYCIEILC